MTYANIMKAFYDCSKGTHLPKIIYHPDDDQKIKDWYIELFPLAHFGDDEELAKVAKERFKDIVYTSKFVFFHGIKLTPDSESAIPGKLSIIATHPQMHYTRKDIEI